MADNSVATQIQVPQQSQNLLQTAMNLQKARQAFASNNPMANPARPTAFNTDSD